VAAAAPLEGIKNPGWTLLHWAAASDEEETVAVFVSAGVVVEAMDIGGETPLPAAARNCNKQKMEVPGTAGAVVSPTDEDGLTPPRKAVLRCQFAAVAAVAVAGAVVKMMDNYGNHEMARHCCSVTMKALVAVGSAVEAMDKDGRMPLLLAAHSDHSGAGGCRCGAGGNGQERLDAAALGDFPGPWWRASIDATAITRPTRDCRMAAAAAGSTGRWWTPPWALRRAGSAA